MKMTLVTIVLRNPFIRLRSDLEACQFFSFQQKKKSRPQKETIISIFFQLTVDENSIYKN